MGQVEHKKNRWGNTPFNEATTEEIQEIITRHAEDKVSSLAGSLVSCDLAQNIKLIKHKEQVIAKAIFRNPKRLDASTSAVLSGTSSVVWVPAWHGTKYHNLTSILKNGLVPSGQTLSNGSIVKPPDNHYGMGETHFGINDWARAIFLSPSVLYSAHACYSERVFSEGKRWCVLVRVWVKSGQYKTFDPTVYDYDPIPGEPEQPEYRVPVQEESQKDVIMRVESQTNVVVGAIIFIQLQFLENLSKYGLDFEGVQKLFDIANQ